MESSHQEHKICVTFVEDSGCLHSNTGCLGSCLLNLGWLMIALTNHASRHDIMSVFVLPSTSTADSSFLPPLLSYCASLTTWEPSMVGGSPSSLCAWAMLFEVRTLLRKSSGSHFTAGKSEPPKFWDLLKVNSQQNIPLGFWVHYPSDCDVDLSWEKWVSTPPRYNSKNTALYFESTYPAKKKQGGPEIWCNFFSRYCPPTPFPAFT